MPVNENCTNARTIMYIMNYKNRTNSIVSFSFSVQDYTIQFQSTCIPSLNSSRKYYYTVPEDIKKCKLIGVYEHIHIANDETIFLTQIPLLQREF